MSNTICLTGPAFSLTGDLSSIDQQVTFQLAFDSTEDKATVLVYEWYLDGVLVVQQNLQMFSANLPCGTHQIGSRILSSGGWSGVRSISCETCRVPVSSIINGPDAVAEGHSATYTVTATFSDGTTQDVTSKYSFTCLDGTFNGGIFTATFNTTTGDTRQSTITATSQISSPLTKEITITDTSTNPPLGVFAVDFYSDTNLNAIALVDNAEVTGNHVAAFTGNNFVPSNSAAADALILASDLINQDVLNWRFEFNIDKIARTYPNLSEIILMIKGRTLTAGTMTGAYSAKTPGTIMTMSGAQGSYIPSFSGGDDVGSLEHFSTEISGGANGSYSETDLPLIMTITYTVVSQGITVVFGNQGPT